ncbi:hypothetical protein jhhlp_006351, partial [Lomentospora prolificans]
CDWEPHGWPGSIKMNSLNILSARVSPPPSTPPSRSNSITSLGLAVQSDLASGDGRKAAGDDSKSSTPPQVEDDPNIISESDYAKHGALDETSPLLGDGNTRSAPWHLIPRRIATSLINSLRWFLSTLAAPGVYLFAFLCNEQGQFAPFYPLRRLSAWYDMKAHGTTASKQSEFAIDEKDGPPLGAHARRHSNTRPRSSVSSGSSSAASESERDAAKLAARTRSKSHSSTRHARSKSFDEAEDSIAGKKSIRIKLSNEDALRQRRHRKTQSAAPRTGKSGQLATPDISAQLKSPTSPVGALTRYPKTPAPPRPLIPRRQPSYLNVEPTPLKHQKTLILDLDETLIHSMSKGGRMSTGHMVEVRLNTTLVGAGGQTSIGPQHPILYYVHKRPFCDHFLRRVCKWYNLVIFTASVQEYADPVIDWLEQERKFFSARFYRQHCTFRHGAFIKDLSSVEPDLSKVMILDNSPLSYMFHQDNAIPIQGWINDPTDSDLLHLVPFLEGLQYVSDVRALLALRGGEDGQHMA